MAKHLFKKGNKEWQRRSKHGRDKTFSTPALLLQAAYEYFQWCEDNPLKAQELKVVSNGAGEGSAVEAHDVNKVRAFTIMGFCLFCGTNSEYWRVFKQQLKENSNTTAQDVSDFNSVIKFIEDTVYTQKFTAASAGLLNANLISRELGLADKQQVENLNFNSVPLTKEELIKHAKDLEDSV